jgi:hypothetical protein
VRLWGAAVGLGAQQLGLQYDCTKYDDDDDDDACCAYMYVCVAAACCEKFLLLPPLLVVERPVHHSTVREPASSESRGWVSA